MTTLHISLLHTLGFLSLLQSPLAVAWQRLLTADVLFPLWFLTVFGLSHQLLTATAHND
jgi:hypothetical protein